MVIRTFDGGAAESWARGLQFVLESYRRRTCRVDVEIVVL